MTIQARPVTITAADVKTFSIGFARQAPEKRKTYPFTSFAEASAQFRKTIGNRGASTAPLCWLNDAEGKPIGYISYNGRVWEGDQWENWQTNPEIVF